MAGIPGDKFPAPNYSAAQTDSRAEDARHQAEVPEFDKALYLLRVPGQQRSSADLLFKD